MAKMKRGGKQNYETPQALIAACERRWGKLTIDLAADEANKKADVYIGEAEDSLKTPWPAQGVCWLNPPFANIEPWARKCEEHMLGGGNVLLLVPASVGALWFVNHIANKADVYLLTKRVSYDGKSPYPKDCLIAHFHPESLGKWEAWDWTKDETPSKPSLVKWPVEFKEAHIVNVSKGGRRAKIVRRTVSKKWRSGENIVEVRWAPSSRYVALINGRAVASGSSMGEAIMMLLTREV